MSTNRQHSINIDLLTSCNQSIRCQGDPVEFDRLVREKRMGVGVETKGAVDYKMKVGSADDFCVDDNVDIKSSDYA